MAPQAKMKTVNGEKVQATDADGNVIYRVRVWDPILKEQTEEHIPGLAEAEAREMEMKLEVHKRGNGKKSLRPDKVPTFAEYVVHFLEWYRTDIEGEPRPYSTWSNAYNNITAYLLPTLGKARIDEIETKHLVKLITTSTKRNGDPLAADSKGKIASVASIVFKQALREGVYRGVDPTALLPKTWGKKSNRRRKLIISLPQVERLAKAMDAHVEGMGDVITVLATTGLRWEEIVAVPVEAVNLAKRTILIQGTASESGGRRFVTPNTKTAAGERTVVIVDQAVEAVARLLDRAERGREKNPGTDKFTRLVNGVRGGYVPYVSWRRYLSVAQGITATQPGGKVSYTAHEFRHCAAALFIATGFTAYEIKTMMGHEKIETTYNIYGHLIQMDHEDIARRLSAMITELTVGAYEVAEAA